MLFYYHMFGPAIGKLQVVQILVTGLTTVLWEKYGEQGNEWKEAVIEITSDQEYYVGCTLLVTSHVS